MRMETTVVLFTRDLRLHDNPALYEAVARSERVVPLFVFDEAITSSDFSTPNRMTFLLECLSDLAASLRELGGALIVRSGDVVAQTMAVVEQSSATALHVAKDASGYAQVREGRLRRACDEARVRLETFDSVTIVSPGDVCPAGADHFRVFTPYWRAWRAAKRRSVVGRPSRIVVPPDIDPGELAARGTTLASPDLPAGGETAARTRLRNWLRDGLAHYADRHDDLAGDGTSRLSPYLHFGCLSPLEIEYRANGADDFIRQLCWRDFHLQVLAARPDLPREHYRERGHRSYAGEGDFLDAWREGKTGYPIVDAGMRQLLREGWMHNRARLITGSFLTKDLLIDWRFGAAHFWEWLVDGDIANNAGNWQWVAGTGNDTRPYRMFNPIRQAHRFDRTVTTCVAISRSSSTSREARSMSRGSSTTLPSIPPRIIDHQNAVREFRRATV